MSNESSPANELPANELPKAYDPSAIEDRWAEYWVRERLFDVALPEPAGVTPDDTQAPTKKFTMLLPPPNVTGRLHMGHMLNQTEMDILTRWHRMSGETALWLPGTDHAGIATQMMVERQLAAEGSSRQQLGREAFTDRVWSWKKEYGGAITTQMRRLGASVDWSREYFTMDEGLSVAVKEAFVRLYQQGLIYRGAYIVNWDPAIQTAVSDLEVETEDRVGKLYHIRYPLADGSGHITIATTRPETMLGDVAIAVNPDDERYTALIGKLAILPLSACGQSQDRQIPILADDWAKPEFGTGAVKVTPAHDPNDFAVGQRHNLPQPTIFDSTAHIDLPGSPYHGLERFAARDRIVTDLETAGLLVRVQDHSMSVPVSQRSGAVIESRLSMQWFIAVSKTPAAGGDSIAAKAIAAVREGHIRFTPEMYAKTYFEWMSNIHDWCISRQLWWGHRIPAWHCDQRHITVARETPTECATCGSTTLNQETDVLDTWFSSGLLPFTVFGWPGKQDSRLKPQGPEGTLIPDTCSLSPDLAAFYPTQLLVTGFDILFFWVARMIMLSTHFMLDVPLLDGAPRSLADAIPFREVYIHALVRDANREKMSKTKGNVIDPIGIITRYGTDAVRFTLASQASPGTDIAFNEARTEGYRAFANKIWNAARFLFMNLERAAQTTGGTRFSPDDATLKLHVPADAPIEARWIVARLAQTSSAVSASLEDYRFDEAANSIYQFFWGDLCDWYLEIVKLRLTFVEEAGPEQSNRDAVQSLAIFVAVFDASLRLLSPFMPFITEELWHALWKDALPAKSIALTRYPVPADFSSLASSAIPDMQLLQELIVAIRGLRKDMAVPEKESTPARIFADDRVAALVRANLDLLRRLARTTEVEFVSTAIGGTASRSTAAFEVEVIYERILDVPAERDRLTRELAKLEKGLQAANRQLTNEAFMAKAPAHIVEGLRRQSSETQMLFDKATSALASLPSA